MGIGLKSLVEATAEELQHQEYPKKEINTLVGKIHEGYWKEIDKAMKSLVKWEEETGRVDRSFNETEKKILVSYLIKDHPEFAAEDAGSSIYVCLKTYPFINFEGWYNDIYVSWNLLPENVKNVLGWRRRDGAGDDFINNWDKYTSIKFGDPDDPRYWDGIRRYNKYHTGVPVNVCWIFSKDGEKSFEKKVG